MTAPLPDLAALGKTRRGVIGIVSMGDMGSGIARMLVAHGYAVLTNVSDRSPDTVSRAEAAGAILVSDDGVLVSYCDVILSIVPPAFAYETAERVGREVGGRGEGKGKGLLYYADLNAVSPGTVREIGGLFEGREGVRFIDGCILGGPPVFVEGEGQWTKPVIPTSGDWGFGSVYGSPELATILRARHIDGEIGKASGLKMVFAGLSKGFAAVALESVTTAREMGVLGELVRSVGELGGEGEIRRLERAVTGLGPKAGRWVREMEEIAVTHMEYGGWGGEHGIFEAAAEIYRTVATETVLGREKIGKRERGTTVEGVAVAVGEGLRKRKEKEEGGGEGEV
ncbi:6-phosphogluconate dehydrogenase [Triangularia verruculosa]|uniref:6-phosphogluconate dehydrogenase n=1 Tax=Triangularia verruculosa TaxID=2587418 RepID=A0AAN7B0G8_9PEZI|nr:6-phosphogluconate dehydrogenase [Triangularia verruculosa]